MSAEVTLLRMLPRVLTNVPFDARQADAALRSMLALIEKLKKEGLMTAVPEHVGGGRYNLRCMITLAGAEHARRAP